jgi:hypothetical protein
MEINGFSVDASAWARFGIDEFPEILANPGAV